MFLLAAVFLKISEIARGTIPCYYPGPPNIVYVFPEPVCPYTKMVELYPSNTSSVALIPTSSNICYCVESLVKMFSKWKREPCTLILLPIISHPSKLKNDFYSGLMRENTRMRLCWLLSSVIPLLFRLFRLFKLVKLMSFEDENTDEWLLFRDDDTLF